MILLIYQFLKEKNWVKNIDTDLNIPGVEWEISINRIKADQYGVDIELIGNAIQMLTHGLKVTEYMPKDNDEEVDIVIKYEREYRTLDELDKILVMVKMVEFHLVFLSIENLSKKLGKLQEVIQQDLKQLNLMYPKELLLIQKSWR